MLVSAVTLVLAAGCLSLPQDDEVLSRLREVEALSDDLTPQDLARLTGMRDIVTGYRRYLPGLQAARTDPSWKIRLAAAYALAQNHFSRSVEAFVEDEHSLVRNFARAVVKRKDLGDCIGEAYVLDESVAARSREFADARLELSPDERNRRMSALVPVILDPPGIESKSDSESELRLSMGRLVDEDPSLAFQALVDACRMNEDDWTRKRALRAMYYFHSDDKAADARMFESASEFIESGAASSDPQVRKAAVEVALSLAPLEAKERWLARGLQDADPEVRYDVYRTGVSLADEAEDRGEPGIADRVLELVSRTRLTDMAERSQRYLTGELSDTRDEILETRDELYNGATHTAPDGRIIVRRYLMVEGRIEDVSEDEYQDALARVGKPYVTRAMFEEISDAEVERIHARQLATGRAIAVPLVREKSGTQAESARSSQTGESDPASRTPPSPARIAIVGLVVALLLLVAGYVLVRRRPG